jgi:proteasome lid subunit RPN8/RPN11
MGRRIEPSESTKTHKTMIDREKLQLPRPLVNQLLRHAQSSPDLEICGLIGGKAGVPATCYPVRNAAPRPECRFALEPREQIEAMRRMRERGEELWAIFHSHPTAPAEPSALDLEQAAYPEALYLVISLDIKGVLEMRGFRLGTDGTVNEVELLLA